MIEQKKKWMTYTYFTRQPEFALKGTHLFSFVDQKIPGMTRVPFSTMTVPVREENFISAWSASTRNKVNKAVREGFVADRGQNLLADVLRLFSLNAERKKLKGYELSHFDSLHPIACSAIVHDGVMLCGHVWLLDRSEKRALLYVNASNYLNEHEDASLTGRAHYFLLWQDGLFFRNLGIELLDLMGYEANTKNPALKGVYSWKEGTHGQTEMLYHYYPVWFYALRQFRKLLTG